MRERLSRTRLRCSSAALSLLARALVAVSERTTGLTGASLALVARVVWVPRCCRGVAAASAGGHQPNTSRTASQDTAL
ncbi:MAG TPA: hypothetical protein VGN19_12920, partial [Pedococcus sp.]|nr:hypothetical protein [Pedococcus sp.]